jgi:uncharacterized protein (TIGR03437 family)
MCRWFATAFFTAILVLGQSVNTQARLQDLNFISTQLPKLHTNFFFQLNPADFNNAVSSLQSKISTLTDAQFDVGLAQLVAMAGDEHTYLALDGGIFQDFPLFFRWLDDGVFVTGASADYSRALGTRLVAVGNTPIDQVVQMLGTVIPHANPQWLHHRAEQYLRGQQFLQGLGILPPTAASPLTFQDLAGNQFTLQVSPGNQTINNAVDPSSGNVPLYLNALGNYWYRYSAPLRMLYFRYALCENDPNNPFPAFAANVLQTLDSNPVDTVIIDLRDNGGGDSNVINPLLSGLFQRLPSLLTNSAFRTYVVINKGTFSSAMDDAALIKSDTLGAAAQFPGQGIETRLVVIGESTGGKPGEYGSTKAFTLPASQLVGQYSTQYFPPPPGIATAASFDPDIAVSTRSTDYFARFDPVIAESLARWSGTTSAPSGNAIVVNGASFRVEEGLAPGSFASAFGAFGQTPDQVLIGGVAGTILSASSAQVNFVVPASSTPGPATVSVRAAGTELASGSATITAAGPGLFVLNPADPWQPGAVENQDYSINSQSNPVAPGSILQIFATGYGPLDSSGAAPVNVYVAGTPAQVLYSGPVVQYPGLWQINAQLPTGTTGQLSLYLIAGNMASNAVTVWIH